jgi:hypothetical protein
MSPDNGFPSAMQPFSRRRGSQPLTAADTERLLAGHGVHPEAPAVQHALAGLLDSAAGPTRDQELAGEAAAVAAFVLATGERAARSAQFRAHTRRGQAIVAGIAAAVVVGFSAAAAADALPAPIQELAHTAFGAPAPRHSVPRHPAPLPKAAPPSSSPAPAASPSPHSPHGKGEAPGKKASPNEPARGKAKGKTAPPGQQKTAAPPGQQKTAAPPGQQKTAAPPGQQKTAAPPGQQRPEPAATGQQKNQAAAAAPVRRTRQAVYDRYHAASFGYGYDAPAQRRTNGGPPAQGSG